MSRVERFLSWRPVLKSFFKKYYVLPKLQNLFPHYKVEEIALLAEKFDWTFSRKGEREKILYADVRYGRFGNNFISAMKALCFAQYFGFRKVLLRKESKAFSLEHDCLGEVAKAPRQKLLARCNDKNFFFFMDCGEYLRTRPELLEATKRIMKESFNLPVPEKKLSPGTLVVHIRSGDIFTGSGVHSGYVQPPLCWYRVCVRQHLSLFPDGCVHMVCEDRGNPCADGLEAWCREQGIPFSCQSRSVQEDFAALMGAESLVSARGSFARPVKVMSDTLRYLYEFSFNYIKPGAYIARDGWENSAEQCQLMLELPESALCLPNDFDQRSQFRQEGVLQNILSLQSDW